VSKLYGLDNQIAQIRDYLTKRTVSCISLVGRPGTGKTAALYHVAEQLGYRVWTVDPLTEDLDKLIERMKLKPMDPTVIHIVSAEAITHSRLEKVVKVAQKTNAFLVLESSEPIGVDCMEIQFFKPKARDVAKIAEELGIPYDRIKMYDDVRQVIMAKYSSAGYESEKSITKEVEHNLKTGEYNDVNDTMLSLLLDSAHMNFYGKDLYLFVKAIQVADKCKRPYPLNGFKVIKPSIISYFLEKLKLTK